MGLLAPRKTQRGEGGHGTLSPCRVGLEKRAAGCAAGAGAQALVHSLRGKEAQCANKAGQHRQHVRGRLGGARVKIDG